MTLHFSPCCMYNSGNKSPKKNKVMGLARRSVVSFFISLSIFLHSPTSSILRISLDSAEAGPRQRGVSYRHPAGPLSTGDIFRLMWLRVPDAGATPAQPFQENTKSPPLVRWGTLARLHRFRSQFHYLEMGRVIVSTL